MSGKRLTMDGRPGGRRAAGHATPAARSTSSAWLRSWCGSIRARSASTRARACSARPARRTNIRLYSENDIRRVLWIRHLTQNLGVNLAGVRVLFELEERLGMRILEQLYSERTERRRPPERRPATSDQRATDATGRARRPPRRTHGHPTKPSKAPATGPETADEHRAATRCARVLPLVALRETVIFPEMIVPLQVGREKSVQALNKAVADGSPIALVTQRQADREDIDRPGRAVRGGHAGQDRPGRPAPGRHRARHRPGPAAPAPARLRVRSTPSSRRASSVSRTRSPRASRSRRWCAPSRARSSSTSSRAHRCRRRPPSPPATSPSRACSPTWSPTART